MKSKEYAFWECPHCGNTMVEKNGYCATFNHQQRKQERLSKKVQVVQPVKKITAKHAKELQDYGVLAKKYKAEHPECEVRIDGVCDGMTTDVHHKAGRGITLLDSETFIASCRSCHNYLHDKMSAEERREKGFLITPKQQTV